MNKKCSNCGEPIKRTTHRELPEYIKGIDSDTLCDNCIDYLIKRWDNAPL